MVEIASVRPSARQPGTDCVFGGCCRVGDHGERRRQRVAKAVVAEDPRDFFDQIDLAFEVEPP